MEIENSPEKKQKEIESPLFAVMLQNGQILIQTFFKNNHNPIWHYHTYKKAQIVQKDPA